MGKCKISRGGGVRFNGITGTYITAAPVKANSFISFKYAGQEEMGSVFTKTSDEPFESSRIFTVDREKSVYCMILSVTSPKALSLKLFHVAEDNTITWGTRMDISKTNYCSLTSMCMTTHGYLLINLSYEHSSTTTGSTNYLQTYKRENLELAFVEEITHTVSSGYIRIRNLQKTDRVFLNKCSRSYSDPSVETVRVDENGHITFDDNRTPVPGSYYVKAVILSGDHRAGLRNSKISDYSKEQIVPVTIGEDFSFTFYPPAEIVSDMSCWITSENVAVSSYIYSSWQSASNHLYKYRITEDMSVSTENMGGSFCRYEIMLPDGAAAGIRVDSNDTAWLNVTSSKSSHTELKTIKGSIHMLNHGRLMIYRTQTAKDGNPDYEIVNIQRVVAGNEKIFGITKQSRKENERINCITGYREANYDNNY